MHRQVHLFASKGRKLNLFDNHYVHCNYYASSYCICCIQGSKNNRAALCLFPKHKLYRVHCQMQSTDKQPKGRSMWNVPAKRLIIKRFISTTLPPLP